MKRLFVLGVVLLVSSICIFGQTHRITGRVLLSDSITAGHGAVAYVNTVAKQAVVDEDGRFELELPKGRYTLDIYLMGYSIAKREIVLEENTDLDVYLEDITESIEEIHVVEKASSTSGMARLRGVDGIGIYEAKKNELIILDDFAANKVTNNARQVFAKVPGLNIWESDFAGLQLDIAARGLGPSRTANFNTRQNGYDMSADALGYPESYYMPAIQAVDRIEVVRGAASLQYGTQFGGMLNFKIKEAPEKSIEVNAEQAIGSFGLWNSFLSVGGRSEKIDYYTYYQYRQGDGWRQNSGFDSQLAFARLGYQMSDKIKLGFEYSYMNYEAQQPGGLRDEDFERGHIEVSHRSRNWFGVSWNLLASTFDYDISSRTKLNLRSFGLMSSRNALGNLNQINQIEDPNQNRTLISDQFSNFGSEARLLHYSEDKASVFLFGARYYNGLTDRKQGDASARPVADFSFLNPDNLENFDYDFPSRNYALFGESKIALNDQLSLTPGVRFEHIRTDAKGTWKQTVRDFAGNVTAENKFEDDRSVVRSFVLFGLGLSYHLHDGVNLYANISENYRSVTFSDLRLSNPNFLLDSTIRDESGFNADIGIRGDILPWLRGDVSLFYLRYNDRIGVLLPPASTLLFRTNVGDSRHYGIEAFLEIDILELMSRPSENAKLSMFSNLSIIDASYVDSQDPAILGRDVEYVPNTMFRTGLQYSWKQFKMTTQYSYVGDQFSDATNSISNPTAVTGIIPSYQVVDLSVEYTPGRYKFTAGINNLTNTEYYTRRAESYPGPGIIPATPRSFYASLGVRL